MAGIFEGLQVLELTRGIAGPMVGMVLADHGATVTRIEAPDDPFAGHPGYRVWNRGKRSAVIDLRDPAGREAFLALADLADVVFDSFRPRVMSRLGIDSATLRARNPRLVTCSVTAYGSGNEESDRPGYEALVAARTGSQWAQRGGIMSTGDLGLPEVDIPEGAEQAARPDGPIFSASPWMSINGFYHAALAIGAALVARERTGRGQHVEASMLGRAMFAAGGRNAGAATTQGTWMNLRGAPRGLFECQDGRWVHQWPLKPLTVILAAEHDRLEDAPPPEYSHIRDDPARVGMEPQVIIELFHWLPIMQAAFKKFPAEDWARWGVRVAEGVQVVRSPEEALSDYLLVEDGSVVEVADHQLGPIRHIGVVTEFDRTPGAVRAPAPVRGQDTATVLAEAAEAAGARPAAMTAPSPVAGTGRGPLAGVRVVDLGLALAGPYGTALLADLGADVIKVNAPWDGPWLATRMGQMANSGKRSVMLHLGQPHGLAAVHRLMETADIVTHNLRWGVAERIGVGYEDVIRRNPSVIYCQSRGFDRARSATNIPGTDQSGSALAGQEWEDGGCGRGGRPFFGTSFGDLGNGFLVAIACVQALYHRDRTGQGQLVGTSILNACLLTSSGTFAFPDGSGPERPRLDSLQLGFHALYRLYETADGWLCVAAVTPAHWERLCRVIGRPELAVDHRFAQPADRAANDEELGKFLSESFAGRTAQEWSGALDEAGVPAEVSVPRFVPPTADQPFLRFSSTPASVPGEAPGLGADTRDVLGEIGLTAEEIEAVCAESETVARRT